MARNIKNVLITLSLVFALVVTCIPAMPVNAEIDLAELEKMANEGYDVDIPFGFNDKVVVQTQSGSRQEVEFKLTIPSSVPEATLDMQINGDFLNSVYLRVLKADKTTSALTKDNYADDSYFDLDTNKFEEYIDLDTNGMFEKRDGHAKIRFFEPGTYYMTYIARGVKGDSFVAFDNLQLRAYRPIKSVTLSQGNEIKIGESSGGKRISNNIVSVTPADADSLIKSVYPLNNQENIVEFSDGQYPDDIEYFNLNPGIGNVTVGLLDERGVLVTEYKVIRLPWEFKAIQATATHNKVNFLDKSYGQYETKADTINIYMVQNGKDVLKHSYVRGGTSTYYPITGLKPNKTYKIKVAYSHSKTGLEGKRATFTVGTAPSKKPVIKSITGKKVTKKSGTLTHNPGKITEYKEKYTYYAMTAKVNLKAKIPGASYYDINGTTTKKLSTTVQLHKGTKGTSKAAVQKKKVTVKVCAVRKVNSYCTAYGPTATKKI